MEKKEWFGEWFNTLYYHILYRNRDDQEAHEFLDHLIDYFQIPSHAKILDLACGKGRHAIYLSQQGFDVTGVDLSEMNIALAAKNAHDRLRFEVHDMRDVYQVGQFDFIFNLFTSFGYFDTKQGNLDVIEAALKSLKPGGKFLLDFLNPYVVVNNLVPNEDKTIENIHFYIERKFTEDEYIVKKITIDDHGQHYEYYEKVKAIRRTEFLDYLQKMNWQVLDIFGDYNLAPYQRETSERLIFVIQK